MLDKELKKNLEGLDDILNLSCEEEKNIQEGYNLNLLILKGLDKLADENPLGRVIIDINEVRTEDTDKHYRIVYKVEMINLL